MNKKERTSLEIYDSFLKGEQNIDPQLLQKVFREVVTVESAFELVENYNMYLRVLISTATNLKALKNRFANYEILHDYCLKITKQTKDMTKEIIK